MKIAEPTVERLVQYHRLLEQLYNEMESSAIYGLAALLGHKALKSPKFDIKALFDVNPEKVGRKIAGISCYHVDDISDVMRKNGIEVVILTVPSSVAQECVDKIVQAGTVKGILNFSPLSIVAPDSVLIYSVDISVELEKLLFYLKHREER